MLNWLDKRITAYIRNRQKRSFDAGHISRITSDWTTTRKSADADIKPSLKRMVVNSRALAQNDDYIKKFTRLLETNVIGQDGIKLQMQILGRDKKTDKPANDTIEAAWKLWGAKYAGVDGVHTWDDICRLCIKTAAIDGEVLIRKVRGFDNPFAFSLQMIEADHLDEELNRDISGQNRISMGIEFNAWRKPVAYHLLAAHPGDDSYLLSGRRYHRVPAEEIIHLFIPERIGQSRGIPWIHAAMTRLKLLGAFEEAALVHARVGASQMGLIVSPDGGYAGDTERADGAVEMEVEPGVFRNVPFGTEFKQFTPNYPNGEFQPFVKAIIRGVSSGIGVPYNSLASDLEGVNFSSIRQGVLEERDYYRVLQTFIIQHLCNKVFNPWLEMGMTTGAINLPLSRFDDFNKPAWRPRGWGWVDPVKDMNAAMLAINSGLNSRTRIAAEQGRDLEEILDELQQEQEMIEARGLSFSVDKKTNADKEIDPDESDNQNRKTLSVV